MQSAKKWAITYNFLFINLSENKWCFSFWHFLQPLVFEFGCHVFYEHYLILFQQSEIFFCFFQMTPLIEVFQLQTACWMTKKVSRENLTHYCTFVLQDTSKQVRTRPARCPKKLVIKSRLFVILWSRVSKWLTMILYRYLPQRNCHNKNEF